MNIKKVTFKNETKSALFCQVDYLQDFGFIFKKEKPCSRTVMVEKTTSGEYYPIPYWADSGREVSSRVWDVLIESMVLSITIGEVNF